MAVSDEHRPLDGSFRHELTSKTPFPSLRLYFLIGILSLSALSIALFIYLCVRLSRTSKKRGTLAKETNLQALSGDSYDVFLSFRGPDTRHGFTDCLYHDLVDAGIHVFRDDESLRVGERISDELLQAIENSKIYIPIFSKNYAASHWCLRELAHMVDCTFKSNENKKILPIFLDVEPDDVKLKTKLYKRALSKHRRKFCVEAVESWKKALIEVDEIKGWNLKNDQGQGELIRSVIRTVSVKLKVAYQNVTEHLVGVDHRVEAIIQKLDVGSDGVRFLIIHGMGGVGKTTLAKAVFNNLFSSFDQCCFLADVRESSKGEDGLVKLQKKLLLKLLGRDSINGILDVNDGINEIRGALRNKRVLIVLDDVDEKEQLKSLAGNGSWFGLCSKIIVTTRYTSVLTEAPNVSTYEVCEMEFDHALKLFSRHAFNSDSPPNHRVSLSKEIVDTLGRLPLSLEITGSSLRGKDKELWIDTLKKLQKAPHKDVQKKLMITYEKLEDGEKEVFLDIACFFVNVDKTYPFYMWDDCEYHPHIAIDVLLLMSLIKIKDDKTFWMHDQVRDLGREIVRQENSKHPSERSRVWKQDEGLSILQQKERSCKVEALSVGIHAEYRFRVRIDQILTRDEFVGLPNLRFFEGRSVSLVGDFKNLLLNLRWLSWDDRDDRDSYYFERTNSFETTNFHPTNLVVLKLSSSYISEEWIGWDQIREAKKLKVLDLSYCRHLKRTPDLSTWVYLERLVLEGCGNLIEIDHSIGKLKLLTLELINCDELKQLPELPPSLSLLTWGCRYMFCPWVDTGAPSQQEIPVITLPTNIGSLSQLKTLTLNCKNVQFLPQLPSSLRQLHLHSLVTTRSPDFSNLKDLSILTFDVCSLELSWIFDAESEYLRMDYCKFRVVDAPLEMKRLRTLKMDNCKLLPEVLDLSRMKLDLSRMKNLEEVELTYCDPIVEICGLEELGSLCSLTVKFCFWLKRMSDLSKLKKLPKLDVGGNWSLNKQEIYLNYWNGEFGGEICNVGGLDLSSVPDNRKANVFFGFDSDNAVETFGLTNPTAAHKLLMMSSLK